MPESTHQSITRSSTVRQQLQAELQGEPLGIRELSQRLHQSEKEVAEHLEHLRLSLRQQGKILEIEPAACRRCGYLFEQRTRITKPGKCPVCRHTGIDPPLFFIAAGN